MEATLLILALALPQDEPPPLRYHSPLPARQRPDVIEADVVVYGATSGGVAAALQARRMGRSAVLAEFGRRVGGLSSGGLGATDIGNKGAIGGLSREFYRRLGKHYGQDEAWKFEPRVAERTFLDWLAAAGVPVHLEKRLWSVKKEGNRIVEIRMEGGDVFRGKAFIDATYEGDLLALAGVSYHVGREANAVYGETLNGVQFGHPHHNFKAPVDPYVVEGDPSSGLLQGVSGDGPGRQGEGDRRVQAYNFRMCLTKAADRLPFPKPRGYDPRRYTLFARYLKAGVWDALRLTTLMPNGKTDTNNYGGFSTDNIGMNYEWPDGPSRGDPSVPKDEAYVKALYATREKIFQEHVTYQQGLLWFLANDERVPEKVRNEVRQWGLPKDEFVETGGWPHQLYVREGRRMVSEYVMTERHCRGHAKAERPAGLAAYTMDSHHCQRTVVGGRARNEGDVEVGGFPPYPVDIRSLVPREAECANLLVPVCLSSSHIAYGSIRMEPVFMILGQTAATAAAFALEAGVPVQRVDYEKLKARLLEDGQVLEWVGPKKR